MRIGVLGTGEVGQAIGGKLVSLGHDVMMGARALNNEKATGFARRTGSKAGTFGDAARHGELIFNCTSGDGSVAAIRQGAGYLAGKTLIDIANPIDGASGFPPALSISNRDSLGETIQREFPEAHVVKALNTVASAIMVDPAILPGEHVVFVSGNDSGAKTQTTELLRSFGWRSIIDLGDITTARGPEQYLPLWLRLWGATGTIEFNIALVKRS